MDNMKLNFSQVSPVFLNPLLKLLASKETGHCENSENLRDMLYQIKCPCLSHLLFKELINS